MRWWAVAGVAGVAAEPPAFYILPPSRVRERRRASDSAGGEKAEREKKRKRKEKGPTRSETEFSASAENDDDTTSPLLALFFIGVGSAAGTVAEREGRWAEKRAGVHEQLAGCSVV